MWSCMDICVRVCDRKGLSGRSGTVKPASPQRPLSGRGAAQLAAAELRPPSTCAADLTCGSLTSPALLAHPSHGNDCTVSGQLTGKVHVVPHTTVLPSMWGNPPFGDRWTDGPLGVHRLSRPPPWSPAGCWFSPVAEMYGLQPGLWPENGSR